MFIKYNSRYYQIVSSQGDGNCVFMSLVQSKIINIHDSNILKKYTFDTVFRMWETGNQLIHALLGKFSIHTTFWEYVQDQKQFGSVCNELDICFVSIVHNIDITVINNLPYGLMGYSTFKFFSQYMDMDSFVPAEGVGIVLYHHLYNNPLTPGWVINHYSVLWEVSPAQCSQRYIYDHPAQFSNASEHNIPTYSSMNFSECEEEEHFISTQSPRQFTHCDDEDSYIASGNEYNYTQPYDHEDSNLSEI